MTFWTKLMDVSMGHLRGAVLHLRENGGKQPSKQSEGMKTSTSYSLGCFLPLLMGGHFPTLMGAFFFIFFCLNFLPSPCLNGPFSSLKIHWKKRFQKRPCRRLLAKLCRSHPHSVCTNCGGENRPNIRLYRQLWVGQALDSVTGHFQISLDGSNVWLGDPSALLVA